MTLLSVIFFLYIKKFTGSNFVHNLEDLRINTSSENKPNFKVKCLTSYLKILVEDEVVIEVPSLNLLAINPDFSMNSKSMTN